MPLFGRFFGGRSMADESWLRDEISEIRKGVGNIRSDVSALAQDVKALGSTQHRHETWLTKIDGDVMSLRNFPQKLDTLEKNQERMKEDISDLKTFKISSTTVQNTKREGLGKFHTFLAISSIIISILTVFGTALFWIFTKISTLPIVS